MDRCMRSITAGLEVQVGGFPLDEVDVFRRRTVDYVVGRISADVDQNWPWSGKSVATGDSLIIWEGSGEASAVEVPGKEVLVRRSRKASLLQRPRWSVEMKSGNESTQS